MTAILDVYAREILDSRGNPTLEVEVLLENGAIGRAAVPSGASTGTNEALELRDGDQKRYSGQGVRKAVKNIRSRIAPAVLKMDASRQVFIDQLMVELDGTETKSELGANAILGVSIAVARAAAASVGLPLYQYIGGTNAKILPMPMMNILNGGEHADNNLDIQEFMVQPIKADSFAEALRMGVEIFHKLRQILRQRSLNTAVGDEGGFAPNLGSNTEAIEVILQAIEKAGYLPGEEVMIAFDAAASSFYNKEQGLYIMNAEEAKPQKDAAAMVEYYSEICDTFPILSIEDGLDENDWEGFKMLTEALGDKVQVIGDDIFVTNRKFLGKGIDMGVCNSILVKLNQIGTLTETLDCIKMARCAGYNVVVSHRSGETEDSTIADLAVATNVGQIKTGAPSRTDRTCKYNRLLRIEEELGRAAQYLGRDGLYSL